MISLLNVVIIFPLLSFLALSLFGRRIGTYGSMIIACINIFSTFVASSYLYFTSSFVLTAFINMWDWADLGGFIVTFGLRYDSLVSIMFLVVSVVSTCVHVYSCVYMYTDPFLSRFLAYLSLFTFFMLLLVASNNFLVLFLGWEGVGLCSYLLISFWYTRAQAGKAATKAFLINKIGDLFLLAAISLIFTTFHTLDFATVGVLSAFLPTDILEIIAFFLFVGAVGKSAQIGLHTWLPDAMEGPTPVSALIHAATMVTAGVFLIIRCSFLLEYAPRVLFVISVWGGITALISGTIGSVQNDIKKIIAYSTCSQLGYMILACGMSLYNIGFFHLFNHAFFKALLFLSAGSIIHLLNNEQDIRKMGGMASITPFTYISILIASLALAGFPFLSGFFSKDFIIESALSKLWFSSQFVFWLSIISAVFTLTYSFRLLEQVFWSNFTGFKAVIISHNKITKIEIVIFGFLGILSAVTGYFFKDIFAGFGSDYFINSIFTLPNSWNSVENEFLSQDIKLLPLIFTIVAFEVENRFFECKWFYNEILNGYLAIPVLLFSRHSFEQHEKRFLELNGPIFLIKTITSVLTRHKFV